MTKFLDYKYVDIGYWRYTKNKDNADDPLPWPIENSIDDINEQVRIILKLQRAFALDKSVVHYRGWSNCRLCGIHNGTTELQIVKDDMMYRIPQGYLHYLIVHNVKADPKVLEALND